MHEQPLSAREFGCCLQGFLEQAVTEGPEEERPFLVRIREHLGAEPSALSVVSLGFASAHAGYMPVTLASLLAPRGGGLVERTQWASGAFIRELLRKAAPLAADESDELVVRDQQLDEALHDLVVEGGKLTESLLGGPQR